MALVEEFRHIPTHVGQGALSISPNASETRKLNGTEEPEPFNVRMLCPRSWDHHPDLFWQVRGGGTIETSPAGPIFGTIILASQGSDL